MICDFDFKSGDLILIHNIAIEKSLHRKMRACYLGPLVVVSRNKVILYFARTKITIPNLSDFLNISTEHLCDMERAQSNGNDDDEERDVEPEAELEDELDSTSSDLEGDADN